jgi:25S rRNA (adenine2142-N1)-methyltransferase
MGKRQRKQPLTTQSKPNGAKFKHSRVETARLIRRFHVLNKELAKLKGDPNSSLRQQKEKSILSEMESMGGLDWYQKASQLGQSKTRGGDSSKWLIQTLKAHCQDALDAAAKPLKRLDIGAVAPDNYKAYASWIHAKPIDLNPQHPDIQQQDFLKMKVPDEKFDIVCLSLVINFVGDPKDRGIKKDIDNRNMLFK